MKKQIYSYTHGFLGFGRMAEVLLRAMLQNNKVQKEDILLCRRSNTALKKLGKELEVATTTDAKVLTEQCRFLWIGVKPYQIAEALNGIQNHLHRDSIVLSMAAGISCKALRKYLGKKVPIVRIMPNTPALVGEGATGIYFSRVPSKIIQYIKQSLQTVGSIVVLSKEHQLDAVTGLSGSGPAFVYSLAEGLIQGGIASGLNPTVSRQLALQTLKGAVAMLQKTKKSPHDLIDQVVSKKGTTEAGLKILKKRRVEESLQSAVLAATHRSQALRKELE